MQQKVIDVSKHNGNIDFEKIKKAGIYGVIVRAGYGRLITQKDPKFEENYSKAKAAGLKVGAYWYSYAVNAAEAQLEANVFNEVLKGKQFELPVYFDIEEKKQVNLGKAVCTAMINAFCSAMEKFGFFAGVYSFDSFFGTNVHDEIYSKYTVWVARVENVQPKICKKYDMWQYTFKMRFEGHDCDFDCSYLYKDFESIIKKVGLNGFDKSENNVAEKPKLFTVTAQLKNIDENKANEIVEACKKLGMKVSKKEVKENG